MSSITNQRNGGSFGKKDKKLQLTLVSVAEPKINEELLKIS